MEFLPEGFANAEEYLGTALDFLGRYEWLYNWPVTGILSSGVLDRLPLDWWRPLRRLTLEELNQLPRGRTPEWWPESLRELVRGCASLRLPAADADLPVPAADPGPLRPALRHALRKGLSPKKLHEVTHLAALVHDLCQRVGVKCVVDMGSGHGYLCEVLHHEYGYRVLGLEAVPARVREAKQRHQDICHALRVPEGVQYMACDVSGDSPDPIVEALSAVLDKHGRPAPFVLVGLHACGDLTPSAMRLYHSIEQLRAMALVSCCYHLMARVDTPPGTPAADQVVSPGRPEEREEKLRLVLQWAQAQPQGEGELELLTHWMGSLLSASAPARPEVFQHFPLSPQTRAAAAARTSPLPSLFLRRPFLRLAAQETVERWEVLSGKGHRNHSVHVMARAVFQLYTTSKRLCVEKRTRRCARRSRMDQGGAAVLEDMVARMLVTESSEEAAEHTQALALLLEALEPLRPLVEALTGLQVALQGVCEGLVLVDRLLAVRAARGHAGIVRVADQMYTPRCFALVATK